MIKTDFEFIKFDAEYQDYWFKVKGETAEELTLKYREQCMVEVAEVVYSKTEDIVGVKRVFYFNYDVVIDNDENLKKMLIKIVNELGDVK